VLADLCLSLPILHLLVSDVGRMFSIRLANGQEGRGAGITDELVIVCHRGASPGRSLDLERCINHRGSSETWRRAYREGSDRRHTRSVRAKTAALGRPSGADFGPTQDEDALLTHSDRRHPQGGAGGSAGKRKQPGVNGLPSAGRYLTARTPMWSWSAAAS
jgi:hypothetical protein